MKFNVKKPCDKCPFRKDIEPYITAARALEIIHALKSGASFSCHETVEYGDMEDEEGEAISINRSDESFCAGALIMVEADGDGPNQIMRIAERLGMYDHKKLNGEQLVYNSFTEMIARYADV